MARRQRGHRRAAGVTPSAAATEAATEAALLRLEEALTWRSVTRSKRPYERRLRRELVRMFRDQAQALERYALPAYRVRMGLQEAALPNDVEEMIQALLGAVAEEFREAIADALIATAARAYAQSLIGGIGISFDLSVEVLTAIMGEQAAALITQINETTRNIVKAILVDGVEQSQSYSSIAKTLRDTFVDFGALQPQQHIRDRATLIAVTEIGNAYTEAQMQAALDMQAAGLVMEKSWLTVQDDRVSDGCRANESVEWILLDSLFPSGHLRPLRFPGCRCALLTRRKPT